MSELDTAPAPYVPTCPHCGEPWDFLDAPTHRHDDVKPIEVEAPNECRKCGKDYLVVYQAVRTEVIP